MAHVYAQRTETRSHRSRLFDVESRFSIIAGRSAARAGAVDRYTHNRDVQGLVDAMEVAFDVADFVSRALEKSDGLAGAIQRAFNVHNGS